MTLLDQLTHLEARQKLFYMLSLLENPQYTCNRISLPSKCVKGLLKRRYGSYYSQDNRVLLDKEGTPILRICNWSYDCHKRVDDLDEELIIEVPANLLKDAIRAVRDRLIEQFIASKSAEERRDKDKEQLVNLLNKYGVPEDMDT